MLGKIESYFTKKTIKSRVSKIEESLEFLYYVKQNGMGIDKAIKILEERKERALKVGESCNIII